MNGHSSMNQLKYFWLSFVNDKLPRGSRFMGACIIPASNEVSAIQIAWQTNCNPGGQVAILELIRNIYPNIKEDYLYRLMSRKEIDDGVFLHDINLNPKITK